MANLVPPETVKVYVNIGRRPHASIDVHKLMRLDKLGWGKRTPLLAEVGRLLQNVFSHTKGSSNVTVSGGSKDAHQE